MPNGQPPDHQHENDRHEHDHDALNLKQAARLLGVHYMTVYRYVRHGRLAARRDGAMWLVERADVEALLANQPPGPGAPRARVDWSERLAARLVAGDETGAWTVVGDALSAGRGVEAIHLEVVAGAVARVGDAVAAGERTAAQERMAVATASRLVARLGGRFPRRGRSRGSVVLAAPPGEHHALPLLLIANLIRHAGYQVVELGTDAPGADVVAAVEAAAERGTRVLAVGLGVTTVERLPAATEVIEQVHQAFPDVAVLLGGQAVRNPEVATLAGATAWSAGPDLVERLAELAADRRRAARADRAARQRVS